MIGFIAIALILSGENFFNGGVSVGYGVRRQYLSSSRLICSTLWLFSDSHGTAVSKPYVLQESVSIKCTLFLYNMGILLKHLLSSNTHNGDTFFDMCNTIIHFFRSQ